MTYHVHRCGTCVSFVGREYMNFVAFVIPGPVAELRPDDVCGDHEAEPDLLTFRLMQRLSTGQTAEWWSKPHRICSQAHLAYELAPV